MEQLKSSSDEQANEQLKTFFVMDAIAKNLDIKTTEEEINGYIAQVAMYRQVRPEKLREQMSRDGSLAQAALEIREIKCIDKILESAKITEVEPKKIAEKHAKAEHKQAKKVAPKPVLDRPREGGDRGKEEKVEKKAEKLKEDKPKEKKAEKTEPKKETKAAPKKPAPKKKTK
jgi:hypothetical protein